MMQPIHRNDRLPGDADVTPKTYYCWWWAPYDGWKLCDARAIDDYQWWLPYLELPDMENIHTLNITMDDYNPWRESILNQLISAYTYECKHSQDPELALAALLSSKVK